MTDSANNNPKNRFNNFNDDLNAMLDKTESAMVSSNDTEDDEDALDRLLMLEGLDAEDPRQADGNEDLAIDDIDLSGEFDDDFEEPILMQVHEEAEVDSTSADELTDDENGDFSTFDELGDDFSESIPIQEQQEKYDSFSDVAIDDETSASVEDEMPDGIEGFFELGNLDEQESDASEFEAVKPAEQIGQTEAIGGYQDDDLLFTDFDDRDETGAATQEAISPEEAPETVPLSMSALDMGEVIAAIKPRWNAEDRFVSDSAGEAASSQFKPGRKPINWFQKIRGSGFESEAEKTRVMAYIAMGLGCAALVAAIGFGLMAYGAKKEASRLTQRVNTVEETIGYSATQKSSDKELDAIKSSIEHLNQRIDGIIEQLPNKAPLSTEAVTNEPTEDLAAKETEQDPLKDLQTRLDTLESKILAVKAAKPEAAKAEVIKPATVAAKVKKSRPQKDNSRTVNAAATWSVNLIAYRQEWYAKSKAAEFEKKGIPVDVIGVKVGNIMWYRLRVGGFKSKREATVYAKKVKKNLNLSSVWVDNIQS